MDTDTPLDRLRAAIAALDAAAAECGCSASVGLHVEGADWPAALASCPLDDRPLVCCQGGGVHSATTSRAIDGRRWAMLARSATDAEAREHAAAHPDRHRRDCPLVSP